MKRLSKVIKDNKIYVILAVFLVCMNILSLLVDRMPQDDRVGQEAVTQEAEVFPEARMFSSTDSVKREEQLKRLALENPRLYAFVGLVNLVIFFLIFVGFLIDVYLIVRFARGKGFELKINFSKTPRWTIGDVIRAILIFMSCGYVVSVGQSFFADLIPVLYNENFRMVFNTAMINLIGISVIFHFVVKKYGHTIADMGLTMKKFAKGVSIAAVSYVSLLPFLVVIMVFTFYVAKWLNYDPPIQPIVRLFMEEKCTGILWLSVLFAAIFGPVAEEIFFRGFMYPALRKKIGSTFAIILTAVIFAGLHAHIVGFLPIVVLGILLTYLYEKTGSLVSSITVHILHNVAMVGLVFLVKNVGFQN